MADPDARDEDGSAFNAHPLFRKLKTWVQRDMEAMRKWREEARTCFDFYAGHQWDDIDRKFLTEQEKRPAITFELIGPMVRSVAGMQSQNRQEVQYLARGMEDDASAEIWTLGGKWFNDQNGGNEADDEAFMDACICGVGFTETRLDYDLYIDGDPARERMDPEEMGWDFNAKGRNLKDAQRIWRRRDMRLGDAKAMFPDVDPWKLDAAWARDGFGEIDSGKGRVERHIETRASGTAGAGDDDDLDDDDIVTLVQVCWWQRDERRRVGDRLLTPEEFDREMEDAEAQMAPFVADLEARAADPLADPDETAALAAELEASRSQIEMTRKGAEKTKERVYYEAFIGQDVLGKEEKAPLQKGFRFKAITGYRDQNKKMFYGIVRAMLDPQKMANKWLSTMIHINDKSAQGGIMMEVGAADDQKKFERDFNQANRISWLADGGIGKIANKPQTQFPSGYMELTNFAARGIRVATGISEEMQGMREANQPGVLEQMRKEQSIAAMAGLFRSMTLYRKEQGTIMFELMKNRVSPERMARIVGDNLAPMVQAAYESEIEYDLVVDETATSPNQKSLVWQLISGIWSGIPPQVQAALFKYSPLPASAAADVQAAYEAFFASQMPAPEDQALDRQERQAGINATIAGTNRTIMGG
jgi:hypothetical protein